jgi:hypothetical protein
MGRFFTSSFNNRDLFKEIDDELAAASGADK